MSENSKKISSQDPLEDLTGSQLAELIKSNDAIDEQEAKILKEEEEEMERASLEGNGIKRKYKRLKRSPLEILNRTFIRFIKRNKKSRLFIVYIVYYIFFFYILIRFRSKRSKNVFF